LRGGITLVVEGVGDPHRCAAQGIKLTQVLLLEQTRIYE